jgi:hypothetical protein
MAGLHRTVHPHANIAWAKLKQIAPDVGVQVKTVAELNGAASDPDLMGLSFTDPDGEQHIYIFTDEGRVNLIRQLTGGLVVPSK